MLFYIIYLSCLLLSTVMALANRQKLKSRQLGFFAPFLCLVLIQELYVFVYLLTYAEPSTAIIYNIYISVAAAFFSLLYHTILRKTSFRKPILWLLISYIAIALTTFIFIKPVTEYNSYLFLAGSLVITCCGIFFLFYYFNLDNTGEEKFWSPVIWITVGIVSFYPVANISLALYKHLLAYRATVFGFKLYRVIPQLMSIFMYSCFAYAFYLCRKRK
jgi:hypothetical protein